MSNRPLTKTEWLASLEELWEAAQQPRPWVGLTEAERLDIIDKEISEQNTEHFALAQAIEAKLKERNT